MTAGLYLVYIHTVRAIIKIFLPLYTLPLFYKHGAEAFGSS